MVAALADNSPFKVNTPQDLAKFKLKSPQHKISSVHHSQAWQAPDSTDSGSLAVQKEEQFVQTRF